MVAAAAVVVVVVVIVVVAAAAAAHPRFAAPPSCHPLSRHPNGGRDHFCSHHKMPCFQVPTIATLFFLSLLVLPFRG